MPGVTNPSGMTISYNGYTFPVTVEPPKISIEPQFDSAGRIIVACKYTVSLSAVIYPGTDESNASLQMADLRTRLSAEACELRIEGTGFSDLVVNERGGRVWDMDWGPKPRVLECAQIGDDLAWRISWVCVAVTSEECPEDTKPLLGRVYEWCYSVRWSVDQRGLTTRTVTGHVMIPITRLVPTSREVPDQADKLREAVKNLIVPEGFRRVPGEATLSENRRRLDFVVTDQQLDSPWAPPPGVILCSGTHQVSNAGTNNWIQYRHTISASYTVARDQPKSRAWQHFAKLWKSRWSQARGGGRQLMLPLSLSMTETLWDMTTSFSISYITLPSKRAAAKKNPLDLLRESMAQATGGSGLWLAPVPTSWTEWAESLKSGAFESRGYAGLKYDVKDDRLVNVCLTGGGSAVRSLASRRPPTRNDPKNLKGTPPPPPGDDEVPEVKVAKDESWVKYESRLVIKEKDDLAKLKTLPLDEVKHRPREIETNSTIAFRSDYVAPKEKPHVFQLRAQPDQEIMFEGKAVRAGYTIDCPRLITVGGAKAYRMNGDGDYFEQEIFANFLTPVVAAKWRQTYVLESTPTRGIGPPDHPVFGALAGVDDGLIGFTALG